MCVRVLVSIRVCACACVHSCVCVCLCPFVCVHGTFCTASVKHQAFILTFVVNRRPFSRVGPSPVAVSTDLTGI